MKRTDDIELYLFVSSLFENAKCASQISLFKLMSAFADGLIVKLGQSLLSPQYYLPPNVLIMSAIKDLGFRWGRWKWLRCLSLICDMLLSVESLFSLCMSVMFCDCDTP